MTKLLLAEKHKIFY